MTTDLRSKITSKIGRVVTALLVAVALVGAAAVPQGTAQAGQTVYVKTLSCPTSLSTAAWDTLTDYGIAVWQQGYTYGVWWYGKNSAGQYVDVYVWSTWYAHGVGCSGWLSPNGNADASEIDWEPVIDHWELPL